MSEFDNLGNIAENTALCILIIILILCFIPTVFYIGSFVLMDDAGVLINKFLHNPIKMDMENNSLQNIWLFSSYIPYKRVKRCNDYGPNDPEKDRYQNYLFKANKIIEKFQKIKKECDGYSYSIIKREADAEIQKNKKIREDQEHEELLKYLDQGYEDGRARSILTQKWIFGIGIAFFNFLKLWLIIGTFIKNIFNFFIPSVPDVLKSQVLTGFIILVVLIITILYSIKLINYKKLDTTYTKTYNGLSTEKKTTSWYDSIYNEISDTLSYYDNMMNTFTIPNLGWIFNSEDSIEEANKENSFVLNRETTEKGKIYDNLSYIMLSELKLPVNELKSYLSIDIESNKYYNIYLPNEKFVNNNIPSIVKWKVNTSTKNNNEKIWKIDCEKIDTIMKNGANTNTPAFINDGEKCIINIDGLNNANPEEEDSSQLIYSTEYIK
jgi:hypothetical protein